MIDAGSLQSSADRKFAVLLLAHGTPETIEEIPEYLKNVVSGRSLPRPVIEEIQHRYAQIGRSPLTDWTNREAELLQKSLDLPVYVGMRNWKPYIAESIGRMRSDGVTDAVAICMAPQNSRTSVGLYRRAAYAAAGAALRFYFVDDWADHPLLVEGFAQRLRPVWLHACREMGEEVPVVFTAHSVPCRTVLVQTTEGSVPSAQHSTSAPTSTAPVRPTDPERSYALPRNTSQDPDPYAIQSKQTASLVAERLAPDGLTAQNWYFAFQSQGASGGPWIGPTVEETLQALHKEGHRGVVVQPIGFLCDHVEILYDIDIAFQKLARELNLKLFRPESLNASPLLIEALANLASRGLTQLNAAPPVPVSTPA